MISAIKNQQKFYCLFQKRNENKFIIDWQNFSPVKPSFTGIKVFDDFDLNEIYKYIDWQPFFIAWEMHGKFPDLLSDEKIGASATKLYEDAQTLLKKIIGEKWLTAKGVIGFWETNKIADDTIEVKIRMEESLDLEFLRQQVKKAPGQPNLSLADFIKPGKGDFIGAFAVSIHGLEPHVEKFNKEFDDYNKIILQALADRLAEAFAELLHQRTRKEFWGYATDEDLNL